MRNLSKHMEILTPCVLLWEYELGAAAVETVQQFLGKLTTESPCDLAVLLLGMHANWSRLGLGYVFALPRLGHYAQ